MVRKKCGYKRTETLENEDKRVSTQGKVDNLNVVDLFDGFGVSFVYRFQNKEGLFAMAKRKEEKLNLDTVLFKCRDILRQARNSGSFFEKRDMMRK